MSDTHGPRPDGPETDPIEILLRHADRTLGDLTDFEADVVASVRAQSGAIDEAAAGLESAVAGTLRGLPATAGPERDRPARRLRPILAAAAVLVVAVTVGLVVMLMRGRPDVLASAQAGELRRAGTNEWTNIDAPVSLRSGDAVRAAGAPTRIEVFSGADVLLHDGSLSLADERNGVSAMLERGTMDVTGREPVSAVNLSIAVGSVRFGVRPGVRTHVRHEPTESRSLVAVLKGTIELERPGADASSPEAIVAGRCLVRDGARGATRYRIADGPLRRSLALLRRRWQYYGRVEARRKSTRVIVVTPDTPRPLDRAIRRLGAARAASPAEMPRTIGFPPRGTAPDGVGDFLATHTRDDQTFAWASLSAGARCDLAEVTAIAARALSAMGWERRAIEIRLDEDGASKRTRTAVRAALGDAAAVAEVSRTIARSPSLGERTWAVLAAGGAGLDLKPLVGAARWVGPKFYAAPWAEATAFAEAVGFACAEARDASGGDALSRILVDRSIALEVRRRFVSGFSRAGRGSRTTHGILLEAFSRVSEPSLKRAILTDLLDHADVVGGEDPAKTRAGVAAFFAMLANARNEYTPLAQRGRFRFAAVSERARVERELLAFLEHDADPAMREASARAFVPARETEAAPSVSDVSLATVAALEAALADPDPGVRYWTGVALARHGRRESTDPLLNAFAAESEAACLRGFVGAMVRLPGAGAERRIVAAIAARLSAERRAEVRVAFVEALGHLGTDLARMVLEDVAAGTDPIDRSAAQRALRALDAADAVRHRGGMNRTDGR